MMDEKPQGLYLIFLARLYSLKPFAKNGLISYPDIFLKLCRNFSISKNQCWYILRQLEERDLLETVTGHGIRLPDRTLDGSRETFTFQISNSYSKKRKKLR